MGLSQAKITFLLTAIMGDSAWLQPDVQHRHGLLSQCAHCGLGTLTDTEHLWALPPTGYTDMVRITGALLLCLLNDAIGY